MKIKVKNLKERLKVNIDLTKDFVKQLEDKYETNTNDADLNPLQVAEDLKMIRLRLWHIQVQADSIQTDQEEIEI